MSMTALLLAAAVPALSQPLPLPPTPAGNAPASVLTAPVAPEGGPAQAFAVGTPVPALWWREFGNDALNALVERALAASPDIAAADATLRQAQELARAQVGTLLPQVDAGYQASRMRASNTIAPPLADQNVMLYSLHTAQVSLSWSPDVFGGGRARLHSARAAAVAQAARRDLARQTVVANLVQSAIQYAALGEEIDATRDAITAYRDVLSLIRVRQKLGAVGASDVAAQETALAAIEGQLPGLERARKAQEAQIAVLIGVAPGSPLPTLPRMDELTLPAQLPLSLPAEVVAHRPDVRAAAAIMEGASADAKAAVAARLPSFTLSAQYGGTANRFADMFASGNPFWTLLGGVSTPIFRAGTLLHQSHAAKAALEAAQAQYRSSALQAFADVSNALTAVKTDGDALAAADRGNRASADSLNFTRRQYELGAVGTFTLLPVLAARAEARSTWVQARAARLVDTVALYQALGGGTGQ